MNILIFNYSHPDLPHISAKRMGTFARQLVQRGHRVVLVTPPLPGVVDETLSAAQPDWSHLVHVIIGHSPKFILQLIRNSRTPALVRRIAIAGCLVSKQGRLFFDWSDPVSKKFGQLPASFKPNVVWGTFGQMDTIWLARKAAHYFGVPYMIDIKDPWRVFVPAFKRQLAAQFDDAAGITINSAFQIDNSLKWFRPAIPFKIIYSGLDKNSLTNPTPKPSITGVLRIVLVGSIYSDDRLNEFFQALDKWMTSDRTEKQSVELIYAGSDAVRVRRIVDTNQFTFMCQIYTFLPQTELFAWYRQASVLCYIHHPDTFHHKLIELLAFSKPIIAYPGELDESVQLAQQYSGEFMVCKTDLELIAAFTEVDKMPIQSERINQAINRDFSWESLTEQLDLYFNNTINI